MYSRWKSCFGGRSILRDGYNKDDKIWDSVLPTPEHDLHKIFPAGDETIRHVVADRGYTQCHDHAKWKLLILHGVSKEPEEYIDASGATKTRKKKVVLTEQQGAENKYVIYFCCYHCHQSFEYHDYRLCLLYTGK